MHKLYISSLFALLIGYCGFPACTPDEPIYRNPQQLIGQPAPTLTSPSTGEIDNHDQQNACTLRIIWATWCKPCKEELPTIDDWVADLSHPVYIELVSGDSDGSRQKIERFLKTHHVAFESYYDQPRVLARHGLQGLPTAFLIKDSTVVAVHEGAMNQQQFRNLIHSESSCIVEPDES